jgi:hypothetical protein
MTADVFRNFPPRHKMAPFNVKFMISVKLQLIISALLVEEKTNFTHFSYIFQAGGSRRWSQETNFFVSCDDIADGRRRSWTIGDIIFDVFS